VIAHAHHVQEERLVDCYLAERCGELPDPPLVDHLEECAQCGERYGKLTRFMDALRKEADLESDAVFSPERLQAQQQHIAHRLEHVSRAARVISFPGRSVSRRISSTPRVATRWIAAAAAAGLFVGVAVGASYQWTGRGGSTGDLIARDRSSARLTPVATRGSSPAEIAADTAFLSDLEVALERPHTPELQAFDALTPHFREIKDQQ